MIPEKPMMAFFAFAALVAVLVIALAVAAAVNGDEPSGRTECVHIGSNPCFPVTHSS